jgi:anaerobic selenocysteine-containing dehydrogenase
VTGICGICPGGCGVRINLVDGKIDKISPIKGHPVGVVCVRGLHAKEIVYSSDRLKVPLRRLILKTWDIRGIPGVTVS